jgi:hypothetical protein
VPEIGITSNEYGAPDRIFISPPAMVPSFGIVAARQKGVDMNILIQTWGGVGDTITAEPAIRFAVENFKCAVSIETSFPELFRHLSFNQVFNCGNELPKQAVDRSKFLIFKSVYSPEELHAEFFCHMGVHRVDYHTLAMWRVQIPTKDRQIKLVPNADETLKAERLIDPDTDVIVHAGRTWPSRTYPQEWWQRALQRLIKKGKRPVLIGSQTAITDRGVVELDGHGCLNLIGQLSLLETTAVLHRAHCLLTNDSAPLHMASSGNAFIGFLSTANDGEHIKHWRQGTFGWRMQDFAKGSVYTNIFNPCPNRLGEFDFANHDVSKFLCEPEELSDWAIMVTGGKWPI